jgi:hypothetical protein
MSTEGILASGKCEHRYYYRLRFFIDDVRTIRSVRFELRKLSVN